MYAIFLVGPSGSGKSTYHENHLSQFAHLSTDKYIIDEAARTGKTYNDIFEDYYATALEAFNHKLSDCHSKNAAYVIDQTNLTEKSRKRKLNIMPSFYKKVAVYFPAYTPEVLFKRTQGRSTHQVPLEVLKQQHADYRIPQKTEGFDLVVSSSHFIDIFKVMDFR